MDEPSQQTVCMTVREIKAGIDRAKAAGVKCEYPIFFDIDGHLYSFAICVAECSGLQTGG